MKTLLFSVVLAAAIPSLAATNDLTAMLQKGLFEEEANHNIPAAIQAYETLIDSFDADRKLAATAVFRLGECYRKQGRTNDAVAQYERVVREFADQPNLIQLSRQNLGMLRPDAPTIASTPAQEEQIRLLQAEIALVERQLEEEKKMVEVGRLSSGDLTRTERELLGLKRQLAASREGNGLAPASDPNEVFRNKLDRLLKLKPDELRIAVQQEFPNPVLTSLLQNLNQAELKLVGLQKDFGPQHQEVVKQQEIIKTLNQQIEAQVQGLIGRLRAKLGEAQGSLAVSDEAASPEDAELARIRKLIQDSPDLINAPQASGETLLDTAAAQGNAAVAQLLVAAGAAVNGIKQPNWAPLHYAANNARNSMVEFLLSRGAKPDIRNSQGLTPLHLAAHKGYEAVARTLLKAGAPVNALTSQEASTLLPGTAQTGMKYPSLAANQTPLHAAAASGYPEVVALLLTNGADVNAIDSQGRTALSYAVGTRSLEMVTSLLKAKADPNAGTEYLPAALAAWLGDTEALRILLQKAGDPNRNGMMQIWGDKRMVSPLAAAVYARNADTARELLSHKADPNWLTSDNYPLTHMALREPEILEALLKAGADANGRGWFTNTLLIEAVSGRYTNAVALLLEHGADPDSARNDGWTALHEAAWGRQEVLAEMLLNKGANSSPATKENVLKMEQMQTTVLAGQTPLHVAVTRAAIGVVQVMLAHDADPNLLDKETRTPLDLATDMLRNNTAGMPPGQRRANPKTLKEISELLRKYGALDEVPRMDRIQVRRPGDPRFSWAVQVSTNAWTHLTVWEVLCMNYGILSDEPKGEGRQSELLVNMGNRMLAFPNLGAVTIKRPEPDRKSWSPSTLDVSPVVRSGDCSKDVRVQVGDIIEVSELDHPINQRWDFFSEAELQNIFKCLARTVHITVKGETSQLKLEPTLSRSMAPSARISLNEPFWLRPVLLDSRLVLASSDLSRVKVTRTDPVTGQKLEGVFDCTGNTPAPEVWLMDGDLIEIPERQ